MFSYFTSKPAESEATMQSVDTSKGVKIEIPVSQGNVAAAPPVVKRL